MLPFVILVACCCQTAPLAAQDCPRPRGKSAVEWRSQYLPSTVFSYARGRDVLYPALASANGGYIRTIYSGISFRLPEGDPTKALYALGVSTEHTWPRSHGAEEYPANADLHMLFPALESVNSMRGNLPYGEVDDSRTRKWILQDAVTRTRPPSENGRASELGPSSFEPADDEKGDLARAQFYFWLMYRESADGAYMESQLDDLLAWNAQDPPSHAERVRDGVIRQIQGNCNPFVWWPQLGRSVFGR